MKILLTLLYLQIKGDCYLFWTMILFGLHFFHFWYTFVLARGPNCIRPPYNFNEFPNISVPCYRNFLMPRNMTKRLLVHPGDLKTRKMFDRAATMWPGSLFDSLTYVNELTANLYVPSNVVIEVDEISETKFTYSIRNNVFSDSYEMDCSNSSRWVVDRSLTFSTLNDNTNLSSEELAAIQSAINQAYLVAFLEQEPLSWRLCTYSNKEVKNLVGNFMDFMVIWLYIVGIVLTHKLYFDIMTQTRGMVKHLSFSPHFLFMSTPNEFIVLVITAKAIFYSFIATVVLTFAMNSTKAVEIFPCSVDSTVLSVTIFTFLVATASLLCNLSIFFNKPFPGFFIVVSAWVLICSVVKKHANTNSLNTSYFTIILVSLLPAGGLIESMEVIFSNAYVEDGGQSVFFGWPSGPRKMIPLSAVLFFMWLGAVMNHIALHLIYRTIRFRFQIPWYLHASKRRLPNHPFPKPANSIFALSSQNVQSEAGKPRAIQVMNLSVEKGSVTILKDINFIAPHLELTVILGGSHSGKSALLTTLAGITKATSGKALIDGIDALTNTEKFKSKIGFFSHQSNLIEFLTVKEHLLFSGLLKGLSWKQMKIEWNRVKTIERFKHEVIHKLSPLRKSLLMLSISLIGSPSLLILVDILSGVNVQCKSEIWNELFKLKCSHTILMSTSCIEDTEALADYVGILDQGKLLCFGSLSFLRNLYHEYFLVSFSFRPDVNAEEGLDRLRERYSMAEENGKISVSLECEEDTPKILELIESSVESQSSIEFVRPRMSNIYAKAVVAENRDEELSKISSILQPTIDVTLNRGSWVKVHALYSKRLWSLLSNHEMLILIIFLWFTIAWSANEALKDCFKSGSLPKVPIQMSRFGSTPVYITDNSTHHTIADAMTNILETQGCQVFHSDIFWMDVFSDGQICSTCKCRLRTLDVLFYRSEMLFSLDTSRNETTIYYSKRAFFSSALAIDLLFNAHLSQMDPPATINTFYHPYKAVTASCWSDLDGKDWFSIIEKCIDSGWWKSGGCQPSETCFVYCSILMKVLIFICSVPLVTAPWKERMTGVRLIQAISGASTLLYWVTERLIGITITSTFCLICYVELFLVFPVIGFYMETATIAIMFQEFLIGVTYLSYYHFISLFLGKISFPSCMTFIKLIFSSSVIIYLGNLIGIFSMVLFLIIGVYEERKPSILHFPYSNTSLWMYYPRQIDNVKHYMCNDHDGWVKNKTLPFPESILTNLSTFESRYKDMKSVIEKLASGYTFLQFVEDLSPYFVINLFVFALIIVKDWWSFERTIRSPPKPQLHPLLVTKKDKKSKVIKASWKNDEESPNKPVLFVYRPKSLVKNSKKEVAYTVERGKCVGFLRSEVNYTNSAYSDILIRTPLPTQNLFYSGCENERFSRSIGYCRRDQSLYSTTTARRELSFFGRLRGLPKSKVNNVVNAWLEVMSLSELANVSLCEYDHSCKKKLGVAISLIGTPFLTVLEEPVEGTDLKTRRRILSVIRYCSRVRNQSIVIVTQDLSLCEEVCDRVVLEHNNNVLYNGGLLQFKSSFCWETVIGIKVRKGLIETEEKLKLVSDQLPESVQLTQRGAWHYFILTDSLPSLSTFFREMISLKSAHNVVDDFSVELFSTRHTLDIINRGCTGDYRLILDTTTGEKLKTSGGQMETSSELPQVT